MKLSREEKRGRLEVKAKQVIEEYLEWEDKHPKSNLTEMEDISLRFERSTFQV